MMRYISVLIILLFTATLLPAQDAFQLIQSGNQYFEKKEYYEAIRFYKEAIKQDEGDQAFAHYQLGESYRFLTDYAKAEYYYQVADSFNDKRYPLAKFQYASMLKRAGKYAEAISVFEEFIALIPGYFDDNAESRDYYDQAKNERDGSLLALNALSEPKPGYALAVLPAAVNTDYNDYAPLLFGDDNLIYVTSARKSKKGAVTDGFFGETFSDLYGYRFSGNKWAPIKAKNTVDNVVNTKFGEGAGVFNADATFFYFTDCPEGKGTCHISYTRKKDGKWTTPAKLNRNINANGYTSKHPALSSTGDTLYFSSDRPGGAGGADIWMSISGNGVSWSPAVNLGPEVNTPFNEISPFADSRRNKLFFASDGHRGFGGLDIYMASGKMPDKVRIYNLGFPFNSNYDDAFIVFGENKGYFASNRPGGPGKFDVYGFDINSGKDVIAEIAAEPAIAGRNSLFSDDQNFENPDLANIRNLVFYLLTARLQGIQPVLSTRLQDFYSSLSVEDKKRVERHVLSRYKRVTEEELRNLDIENEYFLLTSSPADVRHIANMASKYVEEIELSGTIDYDAEDQAYLELLSDADRRKVEQIIFDKAERARNLKVETKNYNNLDRRDKANVDRLANRLLREKKSLDQLTLDIDENLFLKNLGPEERGKIIASMKDKILLLADDQEFMLTPEDKKLYNSFTAEQLESVKSIANGYLLSDADKLSQFLARENLSFYNSVGEKRQQSIDRIIVKIIRNTYLSDILYSEVSEANKSELVKLKESITGAASREEMVATLNSNNYAAGLSSRERNRVMRFLTAGGSDNYLKNRKNSFTMDRKFVVKEYTALKEANREETNEKIFSAPLEEFSGGNSSQNVAGSTVRSNHAQGLEVASQPVKGISAPDPEAIAFYQTLSQEDKLKIDRFIAARYINQDYNNAELISRDLEFEKQLNREEKAHLKLLARRLKEEILATDEEKALTASFVFYNNKATNAKPRWNRVILAYALETGNSSHYVAKPRDYRFYSSLTDTEKNYVGQLEQFRRNTHQVISENMAVEVKNIILTDVVRNIPRYKVQSEKMSIEGTLVDNQGGKPVEAFPVALENYEGKKVYRTDTDPAGKFAFRDIRTEQYRLVSADDRYAANFEKSYFIKDLKVSETLPEAQATANNNTEQIAGSDKPANAGLANPGESSRKNSSGVVYRYLTYKVQPGETVTGIAAKFSIPEELIYELNNLEGDTLREGQEITVLSR